MFDASLHPEIAKALERGQVTMVRWTEDGTLVQREEFARAWHVPTDSIESAVFVSDLLQTG